MVKSKSKHFPKIETDVRDVALEPDCVEICQTDVSRGRIIVNHLSNSAWLILALLGMMVTCIMVVCSLIHWWREEASSLNCSNFFCASASNRGWPGGGSEIDSESESRECVNRTLPGNTSYNWETYVMIDFSSGSGVSTSEG